MIVNDANIELTFRGFEARHTDACNRAFAYWERVTMQVGAPRATRPADGSASFRSCASG